MPSGPHEEPGSQSLSGSLSAAMGPHVPSVPVPFFVALQALHLPVHAVSQQTPSCANPESQSTGSVDAAPFASAGRQLPDLQMSPATQSARVAHAVLHAVAP